MNSITVWISTNLISVTMVCFRLKHFEVESGTRIIKSPLNPQLDESEITYIWGVIYLRVTYFIYDVLKPEKVNDVISENVKVSFYMTIFDKPKKLYDNQMI